MFFYGVNTNLFCKSFLFFKSIPFVKNFKYNNPMNITSRREYLMDYRDFGTRVRTVRRQLGLTQEELSEKVGISASFLGHIERGTRIASLETLVALCNTLNISPVYLLQASLQSSGEGYHFPAETSPEERAMVNRILHLAEETVRSMRK